MSSQGQTVSLYHRTLRGPQSISHSAYGRFSGLYDQSTTQQFILIRGSWIELALIDNSNGAEMTTICRYNTHCIIRNLKVFAFPDHPRDYLALATDTGVFTVLRYNDGISQFEPISSEMYGRSGIRRTVSGQFVAADPLGRSIMLSALERQKIAYAMSTELRIDPHSNHSTRLYNITSGVEHIANNTQTFALAALYTERHHNPLFGAIEANYGEIVSNLVFHPDTLKVNPEHPINKYSVENMCKYLVIYEHEVNLGHLNKLSKIASIPIPATAYDIIPIPITHIYPGGVIVLCENCCYYYAVKSSQQLAEITANSQQVISAQSVHNDAFTILTGIRCDFPIRTTTLSNIANIESNINKTKSNNITSNNTMINSHTTFLLQTKKTHRFFIYLQSEHGDVFQIDLSTISQRDENKALVKNIQAQLSKHDAWDLSINDLLQGIINNVEEVRCYYVDSIPPGSAIHLTNKGQLFLAADTADSALYQLKVRDVLPSQIAYAVASSTTYTHTESVQYALSQHHSPHDHYQATDMDFLITYLPAEIFSAMQFTPTPLNRLSHIINIPSSAPLRAAVMVQQPSSHSALNNLGNLYTAHGTTSRSSITLNKFGKSYNVIASAPLLGIPTAMFPAITNYVNPKHSVVLCSYDNSSTLLSTNTGLDDLSLSILKTDLPTICFGSLYDDFNANRDHQTTLIYNQHDAVYLNSSALIQVTKQSVVCITNNNAPDFNPEQFRAIIDSGEEIGDHSNIRNGLSEWFPGGNDISCADMDHHFVVLGVSSTLKVLSLTFNNALVEIVSEDQDHIVNHITVFKEPFSTTQKMQKDNKLFFVTVGSDCILRTYTMVDVGKTSTKTVVNCDQQFIGTADPSAILLTSTMMGSGGPNTYNTYRNQSKVYFNCHVVVGDALYEYQIDSLSFKFINSDPKPNIIGGGVGANVTTNLCPVPPAAGDLAISSETQYLPTPSADILVCSSSCAPQILQDDMLHPLSVVYHHGSPEDSDVFNPNKSQYTQYPALYNAIYLDSPIGHFIVGYCADELVLCKDEIYPSVLTPSRFYRQDYGPVEVPSYNDPTTAFLPLHSTPITYTCRGLHHMVVSEFCQKYQLTHTPAFPPSAPSATMGDSEDVPQELTLPIENPVTITQTTGISKLVKQDGALLISIEGDEQTLTASTTAALFESEQTALLNHITMFDEQMQADYNIQHTATSNTKNFTGGCPAEYNTGYPVGAGYNGCIRLLNPTTLATYHAIPTPVNMCITTHLIAVMNDATIIILGGHYTQQPTSLANVTPHNAPPVTTGLLVAYEVYYSPISQQWAVKDLHITHTPHRITALQPLYYNQSILVAQSDQLCIYELGKKQLLFKSQFALRRGVISTVSASQQYIILDHTLARNTTIFVGYQGQGYSMVRLSILPPQTAIHHNSSAHPRYGWNLLSNTVDNRYALSSTCVAGGLMTGDRFGNVTLYGLNHDDVISLIKDPSGYNADSKHAVPGTAGATSTPTAVTGSNYYMNEGMTRLHCFADIHIGSPITNLFTVYTSPQKLGGGGPAALKQCVLYTALNGQIGLFKPLTSPLENSVINKCLLYAYNQISLTGMLLRKHLSYWNPVMNVIEGGILMHWVTRVRQYAAIHFGQIAQSTAPVVVYNQNQTHSIDQHYKHFSNIAYEFMAAAEEDNESKQINEMAMYLRLIHSQALR